MKKVSTVVQVEFINTWEKEGTTYYAHSYMMKDGTELNANHKTQNPFKVGDEVEYEVKGQDPKGKNKGSVSKPQAPGAGPGNTYTPAAKKEWVAPDQEAILYQTCLKCATEIFGAKAMQMPEEKQLSDYAFELAKQAQENIAKLKA